ncbi:MAG TPA: HEAT repeat domain-containing protein, partial [Sedimentisphaerales bacterium]|nr:HEAT repeat domain-containing protein [Sedimentisphaerales bacterium]
MARMTIVVAFVVLSVLAPVTRAQDIEKDWTSFLHYAAIGRFDMAVAHGNSILQAQPQPAQMFRLSEENPRGYAALLDMKARSRNEELVDIAGRLLNIIDRGRYERRSDVTVISEEINRLSTTARGRLTAVERLRDAGEYAVPLMLSALADDARKDQFANIAGALGQMDKHAVRPLVAALQTSNAGIKAEIIRALGEIRSPQALPYLKYVVETSRLPTLVSIAANSVNEIDPAARNVSAADLFVSLARSYYNHSDALAPATDGTNANIWFWDDTTAQLTRVPVDIRYFNELMAMRACEWALRADPAKGDAIGIWLAAYFKAESTGLPMPPYFGENYADAATYATIVGPEYVQHALAMALADGNVYMMLGLINALSATGGEASMMRATG